MLFGLQALDLVVIAGYFLAVAAVSWYVSRGGNTAEEFLLAGRRAGRIMIAISTLACSFSAISFVGITGWVRDQGMVGFIGDSGILIGSLFIAAFLIPLYYRRGVVSIYETLETRYHRSVRLLVAALSQLLRVSWLAGLLYAPALMFETITGISVGYWICFMALIGIVSAISGGLKSVMYVDLIQFGVMIVAIVYLILLSCSLLDWDLGMIWRTASEAGVTNFIEIDFNPFEVSTLYYVFGVSLITVSGFGADQMGAQRFLSARDVRQSQQSVLIFPLITISFVFLFYMGAMLTSVYFHVRPELAAGLEKADQYLPQFIKVAMPAGFVGLMIAAVMAASVSSFAGGVISLVTITMEGYLKAFYQGKGERRLLRDTRLVTLAWCLVGVVLSFYVLRLGTVIEWILMVGGYFGGIILAVFLLALYTRTTTTRGVLAGAICGLVITAVAARYNFGTPAEPLRLNLFLYPPIGLASTWVLAFLFSRLLSPGSAARPAAEIQDAADAPSSETALSRSEP